MRMLGEAEGTGDDQFQKGCISEGEVERKGYMWEKKNESAQNRLRKIQKRRVSIRKLDG